MTAKNGVVWHTDHHDSSKKINQNGTFKAKRGGDAAARNLYEAGFLAQEQPPEAGAQEQPPEAGAQEQPTEAVTHGYQNMETNPLEIFGIKWAVGEVLPVPDSIKTEKKFKHAITLGCLKKV